MANGTGPLFYQEVLDALAKDNDPRLALLADLCKAVDAKIALAAVDAARPLVKFPAKDRPLSDISREVYYELMARVLKLAWSGEFARLMKWYQPWPIPSLGEREEERLVSNWQGVLSHVPEPEPGLTPADLIQAWKEELTCLKQAFDDLGRIEVPKIAAVVGAPPEIERGFGTINPLPTLEQQLRDCVRHFFRNTHVLLQHLLEWSVLQLERDRSTALLRITQRLHEDRATLINAQEQLGREKADRAIAMTIRVTEILDGKPPRQPHQYLDAFRPYRSRHVPIGTFDREYLGVLDDKPARLVDTHFMRDRQLDFYFETYGEPRDPRKKLTRDLQLRQDLIKSKHGGRLRIRTNDDLVLFLTNFFEHTVRDLMAPGTGPTKGQSLNDARAIAWRSVLKFLDQYLERMTAHTSFNITEDPPSYLTIDFPRALVGAALHECGVYAVRLAYILLSMSRNVDRTFAGTFDMRARWILLPLHVGLILESRLALLIVHNQSLFLIPDDELSKRETEWSQNTPPGDKDPADPTALRRKFLEDVAASVFNNDVDMPVMTRDVLAGTAPVTPKAIWASYRTNVVPNYARLFSPLVQLRKARQFQFDLKYLEIMQTQKHWFNEAVVPFWNTTCKNIFADREKRLIGDIDANKSEYVTALEKAINDLLDTYDPVFQSKTELSVALRNDPKLLPPGRRAVFAERQLQSARDVAAITKVREHIDDVKALGFSFVDPTTREVVKPLFAREEEMLLLVPE